MKIQPNLITTDENYYFMWGLFGSTLGSITSPIEINFIFVSKNGGTSNYTTGMPTAKYTSTMADSDGNSEASIIEPVHDDYFAGYPTGDSEIFTDQVSAAKIDVQKEDKKGESIGKVYFW